MKNLLVVFVLLVAGVAGVGLYRDSFSLTSASADTKSNIELTVDQKKFHQGRKAAVDSAQSSKVQVTLKDTMPSRKSRVGTLVSVSRDNLTMTDKEGEKHSYALEAGAEITCDGKVCRVGDLKAGMKLRVTSESVDPYAATRIEALDKKEDFD